MSTTKCTLPKEIWSDFHVHTTYCDGADTPREVVSAAIEGGMYALGFSTHSYTFFDESYCIEKQRIEEYKREINGLKREFQDKIRIYCGVEQDYYSDMSTDGFDYIIGSAHYLKVGDEYFAIDHARHLSEDAIKRGYSGDAYAMAEAYFAIMGDMVNKTHANIIGHFDVISKFNEKPEGPLFDIAHPRYIAAWKAALDKLLPTGALFEVNTGGMSRGHRTSPYPEPDMLTYIYKHDGRVILTGDTHAKQNLCYEFESLAPSLTAMGFDLGSTQQAFLTFLGKQTD